jgi:hypothetical protein
VKAARLLVRILRDPSSAASLAPHEWEAVITAARAEQLIGSLAHRVEGVELPPKVASLMTAARVNAAYARTSALWEAEMARRALAPAGVPFVLLKGTALLASGSSAGEGRSVGDLDILVPRDRIDEAERALLDAGWEWVKEDPYDDLYYRQWMHELPPLIHRERDRMIDVHHTILPLTARPTPDAAAMVADRRQLETGLCVPSLEDMIAHSAAHLLADGDLAGGLRNLWDIDRMLRDAPSDGFFGTLLARADHHQLGSAVRRALRLSHHLFGTPVPAALQRLSLTDRLFVRRLLARDGLGRGRRPLTRFLFYVRGHWLRMPPAMLVRHLWIKWRR